MAKKMTKTERLARFASAIATKAATAGGANRAQAVEEGVKSALRRHFKPEFLDSIDEFVAIIATTFSEMSFPLRYALHEVVQEAIIEWLPEDSVLRKTAVVAFPAVAVALGTVLQNQAATRKDIEDVLRPAFTSAFTKEQGGDVETTDKGKPAAAPPAPPVPSFIDQLTKLDSPQRAIYERLGQFAEEEARPGSDVHEDIVGIAAVLQEAAVGAVRNNTTAAMNTLLVHWSEAELTRLGGLTNNVYTTSAEEFLQDPKVVTLVADLLNDHFGHKGGNSVPAAIRDQLDAFFDGHGIGPRWRKLAKELFDIKDAETAIDRVENVVYPAALATLRGTYSALVGGLGLLLFLGAVLWCVWNTAGMEYGLAKEVFTSSELVWRGAGLAANTAFLLLVPAAFLGCAWWIGRAVPERPMEIDNPSAEELVRFEREDDEWRKQFRNSLLQRIAVAAWSISVLPAIATVAGLMAFALQFNWVTGLAVIVIPVICGHFLWPVDDFAGLVRRVTGIGAATGTENAVVATPTRVHRITGTIMIVVMAGVLLCAIGYLTVPQHWALGTLFVTAIMIGLAPILVSRVLAGNSADAPSDVREDSGKQRRWMHTRTPQFLGFGGMLLVYIPMLAFGMNVSMADWFKACEGFEAVKECRVVGGGYATFVDSTERWEVLRNRSAERLEKANKPVGDACVIAKKAVEKAERAYATTVYAEPNATSHGLCQDLAEDKELKTTPEFGEYVKVCAAAQAACTKSS